MCVITVVRNSRPTKPQVEAMYETNSHGGGVAWLKDPDTIAWRKGLKVEEMVDAIDGLPTPFIAHFRIPTGGTGLGPEICHPFPLEDGIPLDLEGETTNGLIFHNGHWNQWKKEIWDIAAGNGVKLPDGDWSDSRAIAFAVHYLGDFALDIINEKVALFRPDGTGEGNITIAGREGNHGGWTTVAGENGGQKDIIVSNTLWESRSFSGFHDVNRQLPVHYRAGKQTSLADSRRESDPKESVPFWQGGMEEITVPEDAEGMLKELEEWRSARLISSGQHRKVRAALNRRLKELTGD